MGANGPFQFLQLRLWRVQVKKNSNKFSKLYVKRKQNEELIEKSINFS
jgi:hypothetical protein